MQSCNAWEVRVVFPVNPVRCCERGPEASVLCAVLQSWRRTPHVRVLLAAVCGSRAWLNQRRVRGTCRLTVLTEAATRRLCCNRSGHSDGQGLLPGFLGFWRPAGLLEWAGFCNRRVGGIGPCWGFAFSSCCRGRKGASLVCYLSLSLLVLETALSLSFLSYTYTVHVCGCVCALSPELPLPELQQPVTEGREGMHMQGGESASTEHVCPF
jgi:hypothetical protein